MNDHPIVFKLGGSLLTIPDLWDRLANVFHQLSSNRVLMIVGGGSSADLIRDLDRRCQFSPERSHWDAIEAMSRNAAMLCRMSASLALASGRHAAADAWASQRIAVLDASVFLKTEESLSDGDTLPASWDVTSDSISMWVALRWPATKLILAKSCDPVSHEVSELVAGGSIDPWFPHLRAGCPLEWLNLRNETLKSVPLSFGRHSPPTV